ncbi:MAG: peptidylprolyl isomerase [Polyangia bacterium]
MNRWLVVARLWALPLGLLSFAGVAHARTIDRVVAVVNDEIILDSELEEFTAPLLKAQLDLDTPEGASTFEALKKKQIERLVDTRLIGQQATELNLKVSSEEVDRAVDEIKKQNKIADAEFEEALKGQGFTLEGYRKNLSRQLLDMKVVNTAVRGRVIVSDEEVRTAYNQSDRQNAGERLAHLREIVIEVPKDATTAEVAKKQALAAKVVAMANSGKDFVELAKAYSESDTRADGGDLGFVQAGNLVDSLSDVVTQMDPGDIRGPVRTLVGWSVLQLVAWKAGNLRPFDEVKDQLRRQLYDAQVEKATAAWIKELRRKAHIDIR